MEGLRPIRCFALAFPFKEDKKCFRLVSVGVVVCLDHGDDKVGPFRVLRHDRFMWAATRKIAFKFVEYFVYNVVFDVFKQYTKMLCTDSR